MRRVSKAGAILTLLVVLTSAAAYADEPPPGTEPPQVRIGPPIGVASTEEPPTLLDLFWIWLQVRIGPPIG